MPGRPKTRVLEPTLRELAGYYPVVTLTGPRQSGKTTLCRKVFKQHTYVSLEAHDVRAHALEDPRGFLHEFQDGAILNEVQRAPDLASYLQEIVDEDPTPGRFILTGSQHFGLTAAFSQSLAGRVGLLNLLPLSLDEVRRFSTDSNDLFEQLWTGGYPRIHDRKIPAHRWLKDYVDTYLERDMRQVLEVGDIERFTTFLKLCAANTAQEVNLSKLGSDVGVSHNTARSWLSVLEASFLCVRIPALHRNVRKRLVKRPKLHFLDSGLVCHLLGIDEPKQLRHHPLRGSVFESWVASEIYKYWIHRGSEARISHYRESSGLEIDLIIEGSEHTWLVEAKSGRTLAGDAFTTLQRAVDHFDGSRARILYGGDRRQRRPFGSAVPWSSISKIDW